MKRFALIAAWICVFVMAACLRFDDLGVRPFHADEATGARITAHRMEATGGQFNPKHYHGPILADLAAPACRMRGETGWAGMSKETLRLVPALAGSLLILLPLMWRRRHGDLVALLAALLLATSPLLVYYSRMFIHESLLVLFGMAALTCVAISPKWGLPGLMLGLMFAAKESFVISVLAWAVAAGVLILENRQIIDWKGMRGLVTRWWLPCLLSMLAALFTALVFYTHGFSHMAGAADAVKTFLVYETVSGHDKAPLYYLHLLFLPQKAAGLWWYGTPVVLLALIAYVRSFAAGFELQQKVAIRFLAYAAAGHFLIYSIFAYKTPWLACLPWAHVCALAGFVLSGTAWRNRFVQACIWALVIISGFTQFRQARLASGRLDSDARNPMTYVPTQKDVEVMAKWLEALRQVTPGQTIEQIAVVGSGYWPLPWYLRSFESVGYWPELPLPPEIEAYPLVFAMPDSAKAVMAATRETHEMLPRGLRADVPLLLFVRNDVWQAWMNAKDQ